MLTEDEIQEQKERQMVKSTGFGGELSVGAKSLSKQKEEALIQTSFLLLLCLCMYFILLFG